MVKLSKRLFTAASMVTAGNRLADVGTDHGYIPIWLVQNGKIEKALAMDIGMGPLERAREHIREEGLEDYIEVRLSDGVDRLENNEADTVLIAGMGGGLVLKILEEGREKLATVRELVLSPQSEVEKVREYLLKSGYHIDREEFICETGKYYTILHAVASDEEAEQYSEWELKYGRITLRSRNPVLKEFLDEKENQLKMILLKLESETTDSANTRKSEIKQELQLICQAKQEMQQMQ